MMLAGAAFALVVAGALAYAQLRERERLARALVAITQLGGTERVSSSEAKDLAVIALFMSASGKPCTSLTQARRALRELVDIGAIRIGFAGLQFCNRLKLPSPAPERRREHLSA